MLNQIWATILRGSVMMLGLALAGCGGGGSDGVSSTPPPPPPPATTPTPPPATTPTPPPATYTKIADMTGNRTFQTGGLSYLEYTTGYTTKFTTQAFGSGTTIAYDAAADSYTVTAPGGASQTFRPADLTPTNPLTPATVRYYRTAGNTVSTLTLVTPGGSVPLSYTVFGTWSTYDSISNSSTVRLAVGGSPTLPRDMPKTGTATYAIQVGGGLNSYFNSTGYYLGNSSGTFSANFATGGITVGLTLAGRVQGNPNNPITDFGTFNGTGTIASGGPGYSGTLSGNYGATGMFSGAFFGPQALETGFGFTVNGRDFDAVGQASGVKQ